MLSSTHVFSDFCDRSHSTHSFYFSLFHMPSAPGASETASSTVLTVRPVSSRKALGFHVSTCTVVRSCDSSGGTAPEGASVVVMFDCANMPVSPVHSGSDVEIFHPWHMIRLHDGRACVICTAFSRLAVVATRSSSDGQTGGAATDAGGAVGGGSPSGQKRSIARPISPYQLLAPQALFGPSSTAGFDHDNDTTAAAAHVVEPATDTNTAPILSLSPSCHVLCLGPMQRGISLSVFVMCLVANDIVSHADGTAASSDVSALVRDAEDGGVALVTLRPSHPMADAVRHEVQPDEPYFLGGLRVARSLVMCDHRALAELVRQATASEPARLLVLHG